MIVLLDTNKSLEKCSKEIGAPCEQLLTPLTRFNLTEPEKPFAIDNGAFAGLNVGSFISLLERESHRRQLCRWVAVPDVVGDARRTLEVFKIWRNKPEMNGWKLAYVCQNGQENLPIPWSHIDAVFIGGDTEWKMGKAAAACVKASKALGKWVHAGRVNTPGRFEYFQKLGADSIDGSGLARYTHMREAIYKAQTEPKLDL